MAEAGREPGSSGLSLPSTGITSMRHHAPLRRGFFFFFAVPGITFPPVPNYMFLISISDLIRMVFAMHVLPTLFSCVFMYSLRSRFSL